MNYILIPLVVILAIMTVVTLVRGIATFLANTKEDLERPEGSGPTANQLMQNKLMMRRILFQAATIVVVAIILFAAKK
jgi:magnesium-transporting ATPase (P-type)